MLLVDWDDYLMNPQVMNHAPFLVGPVGFSDSHDRRISHVIGAVGRDGITRVAGRWADGYLRELRPQFGVVQQ